MSELGKIAGKQEDSLPLFPTWIKDAVMKDSSNLAIMAQEL